MTISRPTSAIGLICFALFLAGCGRNETTAQQPAVPVAAQSSGESVAKPSSQLPPSDAKIAPDASGAAPGAGGSSADGPSQQSPKELTKQEEKTAMPLTGQANNHSAVKSSDVQK